MKKILFVLVAIAVLSTVGAGAVGAEPAAVIQTLPAIHT
ncbi:MULTISPECIES: lipoprotein [Alkalihalophilus]|nr:lipoprotein [Alkalihalophilus marmarensis]MEC2071332.1 lipoprotein [Alkalihalophilus marmarensis]